MAGSPDKWEFVKNGLNVVDVISILPFYIDLFFLQPPDVWVFLNQLKGKKWVPKHALKTKLVMIQRMAIIFSKKGVKRIPTLQPRLQTQHRVHCKQDFRLKLLWRKERRSEKCKTGFPNLQIGASFEACSSLTWSSSNRLHFAGSMCLSSQVSKIPKQKNTPNTKYSTKIHPFQPQHSYKELLLLIFLILVSGIIFASLAYFIEIEEVLY